MEDKPWVGTSTSEARRESDKALAGRLREMLTEAGLRWDDHVATEKIQSAIIAELHHRIKNTLSVATAIAHQSLKNADTLEQASTAILGRFHALGVAHDLLLRNEWNETNGRLIIEEAVAAFRGGDNSSQYILDGEDFSIGATSAVSLSMILNELSTNATKYGSLSVPDGTVSIVWSMGERFNLVWKETGGPKVREPQRKSFGSQLIETALPGQLDGQARIEYEADGVRCTLDVPSASLLH
jgi:two-component sensor histidine kinase